MKIKIELEGLTLEQATGLTNYLSGFNPVPIIEKIREGVIAEDKPKQTRKRAEKVEAPQQEAPQQEDEIKEDAQDETKPEAIEVKEPETVSAPTLMQIRSLVAQKAAEHKDAIKSKLVELGAQNVSTLDAKHFNTIFTFINEL